jgi:hypothetical protein
MLLGNGIRRPMTARRLSYTPSIMSPDTSIKTMHITTKVAVQFLRDFRHLCLLIVSRCQFRVDRLRAMELFEGMGQFE